MVAAAAAPAVLAGGTGGDEVLVDCVIEQHGEHAADGGDGGGGVGRAELFEPGGDVQGGDVAQADVSPAGQDVVAQVGAVVLLGADLDVQGREPALHPCGDGGLAGCGIDPGAASAVGVHVLGVLPSRLGVREAGEDGVAVAGWVGGSGCARSGC